MSARRILELSQANGRTARFRTPWVDPTHAERDPVVLVVSLEDTVDHVLTADDVEELHQFTFEILAGRKRDPRLDGTCEARGHGTLACCLGDGHMRVSPDDESGDLHITSQGVYFRAVPF